MILNRGALACALVALLSPSSAAPQPVDTTNPPPSLDAVKKQPRKLHGRFLQITDIHPDPFYKTYSSTSADSACHRRRGPAGLYGAETSNCDTPFSLVNETFRWIQENLKDSIDFVVWTGDSARHDNDLKLPRTQSQVVEQNEMVVGKFEEVFGGGKDGEGGLMSIPIVPTFGNNDVMPHNIFLKGPNKWSSRYLDIWRGFIPEVQRHSFQEGGWFYVEVIPNQLAVFSINTLFFFDSNSAVDGCASKHEPGYEHMEWLRIQLRIMRERGMKAILMGHVPPARTKTKFSWDETCWQKFTLWQRQYRDVIVGSLFGHMNVDHFILHDFKKIKRDTKRGRMSTAGAWSEKEGGEEDDGDGEGRTRIQVDGEVTVQSASDYLVSLGDMWAKLPVPPKSKSKSLSQSEAEDAETEDEEEGQSLWQWLTSKFSTSKKGKKDKDHKTGKGRKGDKPKKKKKSYYQRIGGPYAERYGIGHVSPSVVPNYFPTLRVYSYNISGLEDVALPPSLYSHSSLSSHFGSQIPLSKREEFSAASQEDWLQEVERAISANKKRKGHKKSKKDRKYPFKVPSPPSKSAPPGPAYSNQPFTLLGYTQYFANLTNINNDFADPKTSPASPFISSVASSGNHTLDEEMADGIGPMKWSEGKHRNHQGKKPRPTPHPKEFKYEVEYDTRDRKDGYELKDLTVRSFLELAARIGRDKRRSVGKNDVFMQKGESEEDEWLGGEEWVDDWEEEDSDDEDDSDDDDEDEDEDEDLWEEHEEEEEDEDGWYDAEKNRKKDKHGKGKKGKHPRKKHPKSDGSWFTFVRRAFVSTMDAHDIEQNFGAVNPAASAPAPDLRQEENMEL